MRAILRGVALVVAFSALAACGALNLDPSADQTAKAAFSHLRAGEDAELEAMLEPAQRGASARSMFGKIRSLLPPGEPEAVEPVNWNNYAGTGGRVVTVLHEYRFPDRQFVHTTTVLVPGKGKDRWLVRAFNVSLVAESALGGSPEDEGAPAD